MVLHTPSSFSCDEVVGCLCLLFGRVIAGCWWGGAEVGEYPSGRVVHPNL